jgi:hypothetical protein
VVARRNAETITADDTTLRHTGLVYGPARVIVPCLRQLGIPSQYDQQRRAYKVSKTRLDDVLVALDIAGYDVDMQQSAW